MSRDAWIALGVVVVVIGAVTLYGAIRLLARMFKLKRMLGELGTGGNIAFWGALIYTIFPIDILPDPIYLDDMAVVGIAVWYLSKLLRERQGLKGVPEAAKAAAQAIRNRPKVGPR